MTDRCARCGCDLGAPNFIVWHDNAGRERVDVVNLPVSEVTDGRAWWRMCAPCAPLAARTIRTLRAINVRPETKFGPGRVNRMPIPRLR